MNYATCLIFLDEISVFMLEYNVFTVINDFELHTHATDFKCLIHKAFGLGVDTHIFSNLSYIM